MEYVQSHEWETTKTNKQTNPGLPVSIIIDKEVKKTMREFDNQPPFS